MKNVEIVEPSARAEVIVRRTYSRPLPGGGFEEWSDIVGRVIGHQRWLWQRALGEKPLTAAQENELEELRGVLLRREGCVSGRTLWLGGSEVAKRREASMFNPCHPDTKFVTNSGVKTFRDFEHGDNVVVKTHTGKWQNAVVSNAGVQPLYEITFVRGNSTQVERFSSVHRWLLADEQTRVTTLEVVDKALVRAPFDFYDWNFEEAPIDEQVYWASGYIYGDGSTDSAGNARVRLCGKEKEAHLDKFITLNCPYSFPPCANQDAFVYFGKYDKKPPARGTDPRLVRAFVHGYLAADGSKCSNAQMRHGLLRYKGILVADKNAQEFVRWAFPMVGVYINNEVQPTTVTNFGPRNPDTIMFRLAALQPDWRAKAIKYLGDEEVWCLTVEEDETFVLANGIVTSNCAHLKVETVHDVVDSFWLLLQGCGVGFQPIVGTLNGFTKPMDIEIVRSERHKLEQKRGRETNEERFYEKDGRLHWHLTVGDSAEAWAKFVGKLLAGKRKADVLVLDFSQVRPAGERLAGYGWISSGDETFAPATQKIAAILNHKHGQLLSRIDIMDIMNHLGTTLSSRRSAEIALIPYDDAEWMEFATAKKEFWLHDRAHRQQSNNSLMFERKPSQAELTSIFGLIADAGGSEPGFVNAAAARRRGPWFAGFNPCAEIILPNKGFCNLVELNLSRFNNRPRQLYEVARLLARANYRQTCVNLDDGILQRAWHENNEFLRLCGVGVTGVAQWGRADDRAMWRMLKYVVRLGATEMAHELGLPEPKAITTVKPSGTLSKIMDTTEGVHKPLGRYIFNNVRFSKHDPYVENLRAANYRVFDDPSSADAVLVTFPVEFSGVQFDEVDGKAVNLESAVDQLDRYKMLMDCYVDHNCSVTISYGLEEVPEIIAWLLENWDTYVGVSFIYRNDPTKTAKDLGYLYLPQEVVGQEEFEAYVAGLRPLKGQEAGTEELIEAADDYTVDSGSECATGACPIR